MPLFNGTNAPTLAVEINYNNTGIFTIGRSTLNGTDVLGVATDNWTAFPITDVRGISIRRGRTRENQKVQPGVLSLTMDNWSGNYDPDNTSSPYRRNGYTMLTAGLEIRVKATWSGVSKYLFIGWVESVETDLSLDPTVVLNCVDDMAWIARQLIPIGTVFNALSPAGMVNNILNIMGYTNTFTNIGSTYRVMSTQTLTADTPAQDLIDQCVEADYGIFFADVTGGVTYGPYESLLTQANLLTFSDQRSNGTIEYDKIVSQPGALYMVNDVTINTGDGFVVNSITYDSMARFSTYPVVLNSTVKGDNGSGVGVLDPDVQNLADYMAQSNAYPKARITSIEWECVGVGFATSQWSNLLTTDLSNRCTVNRTTVDGRTLSYVCFIQAINHDITPDSWRMSFSLSPGA